MEGHPLVSIITPTYNHERFIGQCIQSVLAQTYPHWEQIIVDDGSTDGTGELAGQYDDKRIRYIRQDNMGIWGLSETYNRALQLSQGELIAVLEGDDFWPPGKLEKQVPVFDNEDVILSWGKVATVNTKGKTLGIGPKGFKRLENANYMEMLRSLLIEDFIPACTAMCRKSALLSVGGFKRSEHTPSVDYPTWLELSLLGELSVVDEVLGYWRCHEQQVSSTMVMQIAGASKHSMDFFRSMPRELANGVGLTLDELLANHQRQVTIATFHTGRIALISGNWDKAKEEFGKVLSTESPSSIRLRALVGLVCAYCRLDLEWIAKIMRRPRFKF